MNDSAQPIEIERFRCEDLAEALRRTHIFAATPIAAITGVVERVERVTVKAGATLAEAGEPWRYYWLVLRGRDPR